MLGNFRQIFVLLLGLRKCMQPDLILTLNNIFVPPKTIGTKKSSCYESLRKSDVMSRQKKLKLSLQLNPKITGDFSPSEQIFPEKNRWVPLIVVLCGIMDVSSTTGSCKGPVDSMLSN